MAKNVPNHIKPLKIPKIIILSSKFIAFLSPKWATVYASKLFTTPIKHKIPKREFEMDEKSSQQMITIPVINREINRNTTVKKIPIKTTPIKPDR